jgi:hypothetical protein
MNLGFYGDIMAIQMGIQIELSCRIYIYICHYMSLYIYVCVCVIGCLNMLVNLDD